MTDKEFRVLEALNRENYLTQREIAEKADLSLGGVNSILKSLMGKELLLVKKEGKTVNYRVTPNGIRELETYLKSIEKKKIELHHEHREIKQAVILAAGVPRDFNNPIALLDVEDTTIIERTIKLLYNNNVERIVVVTGYNSEAFEKIARERKLTLVYNDRYKWTGTMHSLSLAKDFIDDDFLLIESDLIFEERTITKLLNTNSRDCILISNESGSGDEAFVEIREGHLYKMSKDIHQFNNIDGEMIGISKISYEVFNKMLDEFKVNRNPFLNYEYMLLDIARNYNIGYIKIDDLVWSEIDNKEHYERVIKNIYPRMKRKELEVKLEAIKDIVSDALKINRDTISAIEPIGGMTNKNFKVTAEGDNLVLRVPGTGTEDMINRVEEKLNAALACKYGFDAELLYFNEDSGVKIARFIENTETLNPTTAKKEENMRLVTGILRRLHNLDIVLDNNFDVFKLIAHYEYLLSKYKGKNFEDYNEVRKKVINLEKTLIDFGVELKPCHNDLVPENLIKSGEDRIYLIDWEYSGMNDPMWDLAAHSLECGFSEDEEELFLSLYFNGRVEERYKIRILINQILQDFLWSLWTNIKEAKGDDFGSYGVERYNRAKRNLEILDKKLN